MQELILVRMPSSSEVVTDPYTVLVTKYNLLILIIVFCCFLILVSLMFIYLVKLLRNKVESSYSNRVISFIAGIIHGKTLDILVAMHFGAIVLNTYAIGIALHFMFVNYIPIGI